MPNATDHAEAALELLTLEDLDALPPAKLRRFEATLYHWHQLAQMRVQQTQAPKLYVTGDAPQRLQRLQTSGVLADLRNGHRVE